MTVKAFTPEDIAKQGLARLRAKADPRKARDVQKYFKETVKSYGVSSPDIRAIAADLYASIKKDWTVADAIRDHDGEALKSRNRFLQLNRDQRQNLLDFLNSN
jgi:hypothetical protein